MYGRKFCRNAVWLALGVLGFSQPGQAIDPRGVKISKEWSVVGVIADGDTKGIAVIKDRAKTYTVRIGDVLPNNPDFRIKSVKRKQVILTDGRDDVTISYQSPSRDAWGEDEPISRFAESYFTGFTTVPIDYYKKRKNAGLGADTGLNDMPFMMKKVADPNDPATEYELFRREQGYGKTFKDAHGTEEDEAESDVYVHYDNFSDEEIDDDASFDRDRKRQRQKGKWQTIPRRALADDYSDNEVEEDGWEDGWEDEEVEGDEGDW